MGIYIYGRVQKIGATVSYLIDPYETHAFHTPPFHTPFHTFSCFVRFIPMKHSCSTLDVSYPPELTSGYCVVVTYLHVGERILPRLHTRYIGAYLNLNLLVTYPLQRYDEKVWNGVVKQVWNTYQAWGREADLKRVWNGYETAMKRVYETGMKRRYETARVSYPGFLDSALHTRHINRCTSQSSWFSDKC